jgi:uncharacterized DUF497 family protein
MEERRIAWDENKNAENKLYTERGEETRLVTAREAEKNDGKRLYRHYGRCSEIRRQQS